MINDSNIQYLIPPESQSDVDIKRMIQLLEQEMANLMMIKPELLHEDNYSTSQAKSHSLAFNGGLKENITLKDIADKLSTMYYRVITVRDVIDMMIKDELSGSLVAEVVEDKITNCEIREKFDKRLKK